jgi:hypothetical protein
MEILWDVDGEVEEEGPHGTFMLCDLSLCL